MSERTDYLKVKEAAEFLGVCPNTVRAWGGQGKIPEFRHPINRFRLYRRSDLESVLGEIEKSRSTPATGSPTPDELNGPAQ